MIITKKKLQQLINDAKMEQPQEDSERQWRNQEISDIWDKMHKMSDDIYELQFKTGIIDERKRKFSINENNIAEPNTKY